MADRSILIVDDETGIHEILEFYFKDLGATCAHAYNGKDAIKMISESEYDLVLCDIAMPGVNGLEVLQSIRSTKINVPFIFVSGAADKESAIQALRLGAHDLIEKPFEKAQILKVVKSVLGVTHNEAPTTAPSAKRPEGNSPLESLFNTINKLDKDLSQTQKTNFTKLRAEYVQKLDEHLSLIKPTITKAELSSLARLMHNIKTAGKSVDETDRAENLAKALEACYICLRAISKIDIKDEVDNLVTAHKLLKECVDEKTSKNVNGKKVEEIVTHLRTYEDSLIKKLKSIV
jgi:DNA-binding response OmpR family regulator